MRRFWIVVSTISLALLAGSGFARADSCAAIESQMRVAAEVSNSKAAQIRKQIAAIRANERQRSCTAEKVAAGGLFNTCRGLAQRREAAERELANTKGSSGAGNRLMGRYRALGCAARSRPALKTSSDRSEAARKSGSRYAGNALYFCVRPSDGYFFPAPNSQFGKKDYARIASEQCRFICEDSSMALYVLEDPDLETGEMVSVETNTPYRDLPSAFHYRDEKFARCNWPRYFALIDELRARTVTPRNLTNAIIPLPTFRPQQQDTVLTSAYSAETVEDAHREIRMIGPIFLPEKNSSFREISRRTQGEDDLVKTFSTLFQIK